jgi:hypothetical protein
LSAEEERRQKPSPTSLGLTEGLRVWFGTGFIGAANTIYGILLVLCILFMLQGVVGALQGWKPGRPPRGRRQR